MFRRRRTQPERIQSTARKIGTRVGQSLEALRFNLIAYQRSLFMGHSDNENI